MRVPLLFVILTLVLLVVGLISLSWGAADLSALEIWQAFLQPKLQNTRFELASQIMWEMRLPRTLTAFVAGAGLSVAGLIMQTVFRNVLAGPYVLGISSGASLGVALVILIGVGAGSWWGIMGAAALGSTITMALVLFLAQLFRSPVTLLVVGLMIGYLVDALVSLLIHFGNPDRLQAFVSWGFGSFGRVTWSELDLLSILIALGLLLLLPSIKFLNTILLGETAAASLGIAVRKNRIISLGSASFLTAVVTVHCGPIGFLGLAVPQLSRGLFKTADHRILIPATILIGGILAIFAGWIANLPTHGGVLPLNAVTALIGAPIVLWTLIKHRGENG